MSHWRHRTDGNTDEIAKAFEQLGFTVDRTNGKWDLTVGFGGLTALVEVRPAGHPLKPREGRQKKFHDTWTGGLYWARTLDDVSRIANMLRTWHRHITEGSLHVDQQKTI